MVLNVSREDLEFFGTGVVFNFLPIFAQGSSTWLGYNLFHVGDNRDVVEICTMTGIPGENVHSYNSCVYNQESVQIQVSITYWL